VTSRIACLLVPDLPWVALVRAHPELAGRPLAVTAGAGPRADVLACSPEAAGRGVRLPCTAAQARAVCAELVVHSASAALEEAARRALLDAALGASPRAELAPVAAGLRAAEAAVFLDASGLTACFGSEAGFAAALSARALRLGLPAVVAVAGSRAVARIAARRHLPGWLARPPGEAGPVEVVTPGGDSAFLAPLPLELLDPPDALAEACTRFGLRRVGDLLRLPRRALLARLGQGGARLLDVVLGAGQEPPPPAAPEARLEESAELEAPVDRLEPLLFVLQALLSRLTARLECRGLGCAELELGLRLAGGAREVRRVGVAAPTGDVRVLLRLAALALETHPPDAEIEEVRVAADGRPLRGDQLDFFRPAGPAPALLGRTLAELEALCGPGRVGAPVVVDTHRPGAFALAPFAPGAAPPPRRERAAGCADGVRESAPPYVHSLTVRALRPALPAHVETRAGSPVRLASAVARGDVVQCAGPWRTSGGWWSEDERFAFDHYDVVTSDGTAARLRYDLARRAWSVDAIYD
jgi:protein ImuB